VADFMLEPDEIEPDRRRPVHLVSGGLHPMEAVPAKRQAKETPPCYAPCEACGCEVLSGETPTGTRVVLDTHLKTYAVHWENGAPGPLVHESRAYPVHICRAVPTAQHPQ
jgi:hypothetical protein